MPTAGSIVAGLLTTGLAYLVLGDLAKAKEHLAMHFGEARGRSYDA